MVFRTPDRFIILDRNGKIVSPFNIKLPTDIPQYLSIFDYFKKYKDEKVINLFNSHLLFYILSILSILCWVIQAPSFRFGFSYIVIFLFLGNIK